MRTAALVAMLVALAGCAQPAETAVSPSTLPAVLPPMPTGFTFECPAGETSQTAQGLCVSTIHTLSESNQEPYLAIDAMRPGVMAIGVNAGHTTGAVNPARAEPGLDLIKLDIFVTEDGGATWMRHELPHIPSKKPPTVLEYGGSGDPALAFDENGVLHVSGIVSWGVFFQGYEIFYTSSPDLGKTWTDPVVFTDDSDNDRNWITVAGGGRVYVPWQNVGDSSEVAYSTDSGATWATSKAAPDCITVSVVALQADEPYFACAGFDPDDFDSTGIRVYHLGSTGDIHESAVVEGEDFSVWPQLVTPPDGSMILTFDDFPTVRWATRATTDSNFSETFDLREAATLDDDLRGMFQYWTAADPWGALHFIIGGTTEGTGALFLRTGVEFRLFHVVVDPTTGALISETLLLSESATESDRRVPPSVAPDYGDHYYGLAFDGERGHLVYTRERGLDITAIVPTLPAQ